MQLKFCWPLAVVGIVTACSTTSPTSPATPKSLTDFQREGARFKNVLSLPEFETAPDAIKATAEKTMSTANASLDAIGRLSPSDVNFLNTVGALDDVGFQIGGTMSRFSLIKETSTNASLREVTTEALKTLQEWAVGLDYREDVYKAVKAYADTQPKLRGEEAKLLAETLRDYRRAGLSLPKAQRDEVERMRKELSNFSTDFDGNVTKAQKSLKFTRAELEGIPESVLSSPGVKTGDDEYTIQVNVTWQYLAVMESTKREDVRKRVLTEQHSLAMVENVPLIQKILALRDQVAKKLGYKTWADYQIEVKMAKDGHRRTSGWMIFSFGR